MVIGENSLFCVGGVGRVVISYNEEEKDIN